ncbi:hypothetical protein [Herbaspirillum rubrisubalbicans]|uniref:hypothetical protein n=1 Tax=Herbaspirillum rubrisubalbicans TaxID=80842 RepID=UPI0011BE9DF9|nr:hypothetical protein [Herbaspirillum rubrisubalbicans]
MKEFNLTRERRARVWVNSSEFPDAMFFNERCVLRSRDVYCQGDQRVRRTAIAVELFIPAGGRFLYGMLSGQAFGREASQSMIQIADITSGRRDKIAGSLAGSLDAITPRVDAEYHDSILEGASAAVQAFEIFPKEFIFCAGRQGALGSSPTLFRRLAHICVTLLASSDADIGRRLEDLVNAT